MLEESADLESEKNITNLTNQDKQDALDNIRKQNGEQW